MEEATRNLLIDRHLAKIRSIARELSKRLPPSFEPDDLVHAAVLALIESSERYKEDAGPWWNFVKRRVYGAMLDSVRKAWPHDELPEAPGPRTPEQIALENEKVRQVLLEISKLPKRDRVYLRLKSQGHKHIQIARKLGISSARVSQIKTRVEKKLKDAA